MQGDQDKSWAPHIVCKQCVEHLRQWTKKVRKSLRFGIPMVWREPKNNFDDCYFCAVSTKGINRKNKKSLDYPNLESAIRPIPHCYEIPVPVFEGLLELKLPGFEEDEASVLSTDSCKTTVSDVDFNLSSLPQLFSQREIYDLTRDLNLSKNISELLASRFKEKTRLQLGTLITFYRKRYSDFLPYLTQENDIVYCKNRSKKNDIVYCKDRSKKKTTSYMENDIVYGKRHRIWKTTSYIIGVAKGGSRGPVLRN